MAMRGCLIACSLLSMLILGGCSISGSKISVMTAGQAETSNCPQFEFCGHGESLSAEGLANVETESADARFVDADRVGLTMLGPVLRPMSPRAGVFYLGAGDSLGQSVFGAYAVIARAEHARELNEMQPPDEAIVSGESVGE